MKNKQSDRKEQPQVQATEKLRELLHCGNERVELSAAKEILANQAAEEKSIDEKMELEVTIRIVGE